MAAKFAPTVSVKAMDSQRWTWRINWIQFKGISFR
jgi:hypothetical protein